MKISKKGTILKEKKQGRGQKRFDLINIIYIATCKCKQRLEIFHVLDNFVLLVNLLVLKSFGHISNGLVLL